MFEEHMCLRSRLQGLHVGNKTYPLLVGRFTMSCVRAHFAHKYYS